ncbi:MULTISPECIES: amidophosphoribosyltransferase [Methylobacter]|uniref:Amidophosphoribosyltransferase n=2 Tax=Methylobacter tundripaludum TaxID=173365 RepID=G3IQL0_METTV|nr:MULTISPECIES: amidophosphoribosyltransferase [Methylobacter]EGW22096.1 amidophosphoribosyltransferase [Methylobacter tundripaludum SV96]MDD4905807.1 amidophosphoribosyltransferase [Methylobacter tundripaludum]MDI1277224.1 amidophosphoribosyltransferase [Methylobacter sp.]MDI1357786.1 amidophosphoribosyltransferase [Methylobacter sp.]PPK76506.1 amidophosphoribosyltransferase [Methylobacter tundripaludum]
MCGIAAIVSHQTVNQELYDALTVLQHRGQDAAGIVTCEAGRLHLRKENGLTRDVFTNAQMLRLKGNMGIAHVRYPTAGCTSSAEAQPFYVNSPFGLTLAHNGNLTNTEELKKALFVEDQRHINTDSDSEVLLNVFAHELQSLGKLQLSVDDVFQAVSGVHRRCRGAYAVVIMIAGFGILGFRDPHGIRPIVFGERKSEQGSEFMIASESVALDVLGFELIRDIEPGEAVFIEESGVLHTKQCSDEVDHCPCIFEYVYFARPDSIIDRISVYKARLRMGEKLAKKVLRDWPDHDIDVVIPIPDTSRTAALQMANILGVKYREGFIKNRYIGRTFIMPGQKMREKSVKQKLNAISLEFEGKNVLLVDDSIVRGTTSEQIIQMARDAGAKKVYFASAAPPVRYPNVYGIDMPAAHELIAHDRTEDEVRVAIGADRVIYQELNDLIDAVRKGNQDIQHFDTSCFSKEYITGDIDDEYLERTEALRNDGAQAERNSENFIIGMQNGD